MAAKPAIGSTPLPASLENAFADEQLFTVPRLPEQYAKRKLTPEEKARLEKYKSLTPEQRRELRDRMKKYKQMSPLERELYRRRLMQWQNIPPEKRKRLKNKLEHWDDLSPSEQEQIRQQFR